MDRMTWLASALTTALVFTTGLSQAADQAQQEMVTGRQLMTEQEHAEHQARMRAAETDEERQQIRKEQHERMKQRASERGLAMPDDPPAKSGSKQHKREYAD